MEKMNVEDLVDEL